jgi:hypothetical protein
LEHKDALNLKVGGTFLWVSLALDELMGPGKTTTMKQVLKKLDDLPTDLYEIYDKILGKINEEDAVDAIKLLHCVVAALRPLTLAELAEAHAFMMLDWPKTLAELEEAAQDLADIHKICGCLLYVDAQNNTVNLIHQSAKGYLSSHLQHPTLVAYNVVEENASLSMFESCWRCLSLSDLDDFSTEMFSVCEAGIEPYFNFG